MSNEPRQNSRPRAFILACSGIVVILFASLIIVDILDKPMADEWRIVTGLSSLGTIAASLALIALRLRWLREFFLGPYEGRVWRPRRLDAGIGLVAASFGVFGMLTAVDRLRDSADLAH